MKKLFFENFDKDSPLKKKYLRGNQVPLMSKELHSAIMKN